jgi:hypothetical protein
MKRARMALGSLLMMGIFAIAGCGGDSGPSELDACNQLYASICNKLFDCLPQATLQANKDVYGLNRGDCATKFQSTQCTATKVMCDSGTKYHADKADQCLGGIKALSCNDISNDNITVPSICDQVCQ